jgi:hypothetical protein
MGSTPVMQGDLAQEFKLSEVVRFVTHIGHHKVGTRHDEIVLRDHLGGLRSGHSANAHDDRGLRRIVCPD